MKKNGDAGSSDSHPSRPRGPIRRWSYAVVRRVNRGLASFDRSPAQTPLERDDFYTRMYLECIERDLARAPGEPGQCTVLDAGCGTGRLTVPLAEMGYTVVGIDYHRPSLDGARARAERAGVVIEFIEGDLLAQLRQLEDESVSIVVCLGVLYTCMDHREILHELHRVLRTGGLLLADFKSRFFMLTTLLRQGKLAAAERVALDREGVLQLALAPAYYWWTTADEARTLLIELGMEVLGMDPLARFFGFAYDGMAGVLDVDTLSSREEFDILHRVERAALPGNLDIAKYIYVAARKSGAPRA